MPPTLGANLQAIDRQKFVGAEARLGTIFGVFRGDLAASNSAYAPTDIAARLQYRFTDPSTPDSLNRNLLANITYLGASFTPLGTTTPSNPTAFDTGVVYGQKLPDDWFGSIGLSMQFDRSSTPESHALDLTLSRRLSDSLYLDILGRRTRAWGNRRRPACSCPCRGFRSIHASG